MDRTREQATRMQEQSQGMLQQIQHHSPDSRQVLGSVAAITGVVVALVMGGVAVGGVVIALLLATPLFLLFSPILVPLGIVGALTTAGFLSVSAMFVAFCSALAWIYNYFQGRHPIGANQLDAVKHNISDTAFHVAGKAREAATKVAPSA